MPWRSGGPRRGDKGDESEEEVLAAERHKERECQLKRMGKRGRIGRKEARRRRKFGHKEAQRGAPGIVRSEEVGVLFAGRKMEINLGTEKHKEGDDR